MPFFGDEYDNFCGLTGDPVDLVRALLAVSSAGDVDIVGIVGRDEL